MERFFVFLENMRAKPEHTRRSFAIGVSLGITLLMLVIWGAFILPRTISTASKDSKSIPLPGPTDTSVQNQNTGQAPQDFGTMWQQMQAKYGNGSANTAPQGNTGSNTNTNTSVSGTAGNGTTVDPASNPTVPKNYNPDLPVLPEDVQTPSYPTY